VKAKPTVHLAQSHHQLFMTFSAVKRQAKAYHQPLNAKNEPPAAVRIRDAPEIYHLPMALQRNTIQKF
jgi:hypothetical protein